MQRDSNTYSQYIKNSQESTFSYANLKMMNESSKRYSKLLSLIFILNCLSKASVIRSSKNVCNLVLGVLANILEHKRRQNKSITVYIKHQTPSNSIHLHCAIFQLRYASEHLRSWILLIFLICDFEKLRRVVIKKESKT